ncbi:class I SAM-dependent methyltransferase [Kineosporia sp. J2-2]|uniref:Class I SAM-dependent methyltransferase n=1 Tax=Kineosporia corallincola TaxID=2835133 RepID=A0ABS5TT96_9ACTN|nr:class I SAM-dependent methyltransferase [Kineosporia corallincola]MBT0774013.1 class I SAM-dependent methyltransferase [Kineosporia corallincola]
MSADVTAYADMAEFYELVAEQQAARSGPLLRRSLEGAGPGPVVEIGAGTGRITEIIAQALPERSVLAVEPAAGMRAVLVSRLAADPALAARVTVSAQTAPDLTLPGRIGAAVVFGVAGHLDAGRRTTLWRRLRERLSPGGVIVVELMGVRSTRPLPEACQLRSRIGDLTYEWWVGGVPEREGAMRFTSRWRVLDDTGRVHREVHGGYLWHAVGVPELAAESGMRVEAMGGRTGSGLPEVAVLRTGSPS